MATEGFARWHMRVLAETAAGGCGPIPLITLGATNYILPFRKRHGHDLPDWVASRTHQIYSISLPDLLNLGLMLVVVILDTVETAGGAKIDEDTIDTWRARIADENKWWVSTHTYYWWDWANKTIYQDPARCSNPSGIYEVKDLLLDIISTIITAFLLFFLAKNFGSMTKKVGKVFGKQMNRRKAKKLKGLAYDTNQSIKEALDELVKLQLEVEEEVNPDLDTIIDQTRNINI